MLVVIHGHTIVHPRTMTTTASARVTMSQFCPAMDSLVFLGYTSPATLTVLASQRFANHTCCTKMGLVKSIVFDKLVNRLLRLSAADSLRNISRISRHGHGVKISTKAVACRECNVQ